MIQKIVCDRVALSKVCQPATKSDNIKETVQDLKDTLATKKGWGLTANQIGVDKKISFVKLPKGFSQNEEGWVLINAVITTKDNPIKFIGEGCLSFLGIKVTTKRYNFIAVEYYNEKMEQKTAIFTGYEAVAIQHEIDHQSGILIFNRKWVAK